LNISSVEGHQRSAARRSAHAPRTTPRYSQLNTARAARARRRHPGRGGPSVAWPSVLSRCSGIARLSCQAARLVLAKVAWGLWGRVSAPRPPPQAQVGTGPVAAGLPRASPHPKTLREGDDSLAALLVEAVGRNLAT